MNNKEAKKYILQHWSLSSGKRITEMLKRYWQLTKENKQEELISATKKIFNI